MKINIRDIVEADEEKISSEDSIDEAFDKLKGVKPEAEQDSVAEDEPEVKQEPEAEPEPAVEQEPEAEDKPEVEQEPEAEDKPAVKQELEVEPGSEVEQEPEAEPVAEDKPEVEQEPEPAVEQEPEVEPEPEVEQEPGAEPVAEDKSEVEPEPEPEAEAEDKQQTLPLDKLDEQSVAEAEPEKPTEPQPTADKQPESEIETEALQEEPAETEPISKPNRRLPSTFFKKHCWLFCIGAALLLMVVWAFVAMNMIPREVNATINGTVYTVDSKAYTIKEFLEEQDINYSPEDYINKPVSTIIYDGISFEMTHATNIIVKADGKVKRYKTLSRTVKFALEDCNVKVGKRDIVEPGLDQNLKDNMRIIVKRVTAKKEVVEEKIPFKTVEKDDTSLNEGTTKVVSEGAPGKARVTYEVLYVDGKEYSRTELSRETITAAVDKVIAKGTRINYNGTTYSRKLTVKAYSYTGGGRTAMGTRARVGEIAVDPSVIPLGTNVYIEGVGPRRAEDTGGNIKGNTIDIYMNTQSECINWGVRYVTIYIQ